jgi:hypothetical protein
MHLLARLAVAESAICSAAVYVHRIVMAETPTTELIPKTPTLLPMRSVQDKIVLMENAPAIYAS